MCCVQLLVFRNSRLNELHLFAVNIKKYHWLVHQPITDHNLPRYYTE